MESQQPITGNSKVSLPPKIKRTLIGFASIISLITMITLVWPFLSSVVFQEAETVQEAASVTPGRTAFDGKVTNQADPVAAERYCQDLGDYASSLGDESKIKDICVLDWVGAEWLPKMSSAQIEKMANEDPTCLTTGYGKDGFNCFTNRDKNGCGRDGLDENGVECAPASTTNVAQFPLLDKGKICDLMSECSNEVEFNKDGVNKYGCTRQGRMEDGSICPNEYLTPIYGADNLDQHGFTKGGMNKFACDKQGLKADGTLCPIDQITRVYGRDKKDQFGFFEDGFNDKDCNIRGVHRTGRACLASEITHVRTNGDTDQFGLNPRGYSITTGCNLQGLKENGERCSLLETPLIYGDDGFNQFSLRKNGLNDKNCSIDGLKPDGTACTYDEIPKIIDPVTGKNQFGLLPNGRNEFDCDIFGKKQDGRTCTPSEMASTDASKFTIKGRPEGVDELLDGEFNQYGCALTGLNKEGKLCPSHHIPRRYVGGFDQFGLDPEFFNKKGCNISGVDKNGDLCAFSDIPRIFDKSELDQFGIGSNNVNANGCSFEGFKTDGTRCEIEEMTRIFSTDGVDHLNLTKDGYSAETGCNLKGVRADGSSCSLNDIPRHRDSKGFDQFALDAFNRAENGCGIDGLRADGTLCSPQDTPKNPSTTIANSGLAWGELNSNGCDISGRRKDGSLCSIEQISRVFQNDNRDQFGIDPAGFNPSGCSLAGFKSNGDLCEWDDITKLTSKNGQTQFDNEPSLLSARAKAMNPLTDANGRHLLINGQRVVRGDDGYIRDAETGEKVLDLGGKAIRLTNDGLFLNDAGEKSIVEPYWESNSSLKPTDTILSGAGIEALVASDGTALMFNEKLLGLNDKGEVIDLATGLRVNGDDGLPLIMKDGDVLNSKGEKVVLKKTNNEPYDGDVYSGVGSGLVTAENGTPFSINGEPLVTDAKGALFSAVTGRAIVDPKSGKPLFLSPNGQMVDAEGQVSSLSPEGKLVISKTKAPALVNGKIMLSDGKPVILDDKGSVVDPITGVTIKKGGKALQVKNGKLVSDAGVPVTSTLQVKDMQAFDGSEKIIIDPRSASALDGVIKNQNGDLLTVGGRLVSTSASGELVDFLTGSPVLDKSGKRLKISPDGLGIITVDGSAADVDVSSLGSTPLRSTDVAGQQQSLLGEDGEQLYFNKKQISMLPSGEVVDALTGDIIKGEDGKPLLFNNGELTTSDGKKVSVQTANGEDYTDDILKQNVGLLLGSDGQPLELMGERVWVDQNGVLRSASTGAQLRDPKTGELLSLVDGDIVDAKGDKSSLDPSGDVIVDDKVSAILSGGKPVLIDGKPVGVRKDGTVVDLSSGAPIKDAKNGQALILKDGVIKTASGAKPSNSIGRLSAASLLPSAVSLAAEKSNQSQDVLDVASGLFNEKGCDINGLNASGLRCPIENITRIRKDPNGPDQFGIFPNGRNKFGCDLTGRKIDGTLCSLDETPRIFDKNNTDQFALSPSGRNQYGCDINHRKPDGEICSDQERVKTFGVGEKDALGIGPSGFNPAGCNEHGFRSDGTRCELKDIPRMFFDGKDQFGILENGFNDAGCNINGQKQDGTLCDPEDIPRIYNPSTKEDQFGLINGVNENGCDLRGYRTDGTLCDLSQVTRLISSDKKDQFGIFVQTGRNESGCDINNLDANGNVCPPKTMIRFTKKDGKDQFDLDANLRNDKGCGVDGLDANGVACLEKDIPRILVDKVKQTDQFGETIGSKTIASGCGINGLNSNGKPCDLANIPRIVGSDRVDQFGINVDTGVNINGCSIAGTKEDGTLCNPKDVPRIVGINGFDQLNRDKNGLDPQGYDINKLDASGCDAFHNNSEGEPCDRNLPVKLSLQDNEYLVAQNTRLTAWYTERQSKKTPKTEVKKGTLAARKEKEAQDKAARDAVFQSIAAQQATSGQTVAPGSTLPEGADGIPEIPMGLMAIVEVKTPVNSDYTDDVYGVISGGELDGSVVRGKIEIPHLDNVVMPRDKFRYVFNEMVFNRKTITIDAVTVSMDDDSGMVKADDVDYHRWQRYGGLFIASAVQALDASFLDSQEEKTLKEQAEMIGDAQTIIGSYGQNTTNLTKQNMKVATDYVSGIAKEQFFRRPTITKRGSTHQVLIFRTAVDNDELPMVYSEVD